MNRAKTADAVLAMLAVVDDAIGLAAPWAVQEARPSGRSIRADAHNLRLDLEAAAEVIRVGRERRLNAGILARYGSAASALMGLANEAMERMDSVRLGRIPSRYDAALDGVIDANHHLFAVAEAKDLDATLAWHCDYFDALIETRLDAFRTVAPSPRQKIERDIRALVWSKSGGRCWYCGTQTNPFDDFRVDHVVPVADGGTNDPANLAPACHPCNAAKGAMALEAFRTRQRGNGLFWFETMRGATS